MAIKRTRKPGGGRKVTIGKSKTVRVPLPVLPAVEKIVSEYKDKFK